MNLKVDVWLTAVSWEIKLLLYSLSEQDSNDLLGTVYLQFYVHMYFQLLYIIIFTGKGKTQIRTLPLSWIAIQCKNPTKSY